MLKSIVRLFHTLKHIKAIQFYFQVWYRVKYKFLSIHWYQNYSNDSIQTAFPLQVDTFLRIDSQECFPDNYFTFIGLSHAFPEQIDWNYSANGKLWNYHLQYFHYLLDERVDSKHRLELLHQFSDSLLNRKIAPEPYPVSLRIINTLLFNNKYPIKDEIVIKALLLQIDYLEHNLEYHILGNHLLENVFALYISSHYLSNVRLHAKASKLLCEQLDEQILTDGGHYECSPMYHSIILAKLLLCIEIASQSQLTNGVTIRYLKSTAGKMLGWLNAFSFPDGSWALMNDAAESMSPNTKQLQTAASYLHIDPQKTKFFDSGFRKLTGKNWEVLIKTGNIQPSYQPGHVHADLLSFCLWYKGKQVIVDAGTSTYTISNQRASERSTTVHNTVCIGEKNQSDVWGGFRVGKRAICNLKTDLPGQVVATIYNYGGQPWQHERMFFADSDFLIIKDNVLGLGKSKDNILGGILLAKDLLPIKKGGDLYFGNISLSTSNTDLELTSSVYANSFNHLQKTTRILYQVSGSVELKFNFL